MKKCYTIIADFDDDSCASQIFANSPEAAVLLWMQDTPLPAIEILTRKSIDNPKKILSKYCFEEEISIGKMENLYNVWCTNIYFEKFDTSFIMNIILNKLYFNYG